MPRFKQAVIIHHLFTTSLRIQITDIHNHMHFEYLFNAQNIYTLSVKVKLTSCL